MKSILDKTFSYTNAACTDISKTFERIRRQQKRTEQKSNVSNLPTKAQATRSPQK